MWHQFGAMVVESQDCRGFWAKASEATKTVGLSSCVTGVHVHSADQTRLETTTMPTYAFGAGHG